MHVDYYLSINDLPPECVVDCSNPGDRTETVRAWRNELEFTVDQPLARICLKRYGAWDDDDLAKMSDDEVAETILWLACCDFREYGVEGMFVLE